MSTTLFARGRAPLRTVARYGIAHLYSRVNRRVFVVNEFPKSGGTWVCSMLSAALGLPFHDNLVPPWESQILKGHFLWPGGIPRGVLVWRDGRDVTTSFYYHSFFKFSDTDINHKFVDMMRNKYRFRTYTDIEANMPAFLQAELSSPSYPSFTWSQFVRRWYGHPHMRSIKYEDLRNDPTASISDLALQLTGSPPSYDQLSTAIEAMDMRRKVNASTDSSERIPFARKGMIGEYRVAFNKESIALFEQYAGTALRILGYI